MHNIFEVEWKDYNNKQCILLIFDTDHESEDYTVKHLVPGTNPFVTSTTCDSKLFQPILDGSAQISLVANFELIDEFNFTHANRYRVWLQVDGVIRWRGVLTNEALNQPWHSEMDEFVLNAKSDIALLDTFNLDTDVVRSSLPYVLHAAYEEISAWDVSEVWTNIDERLTGIRQTKFYFPVGNKDVVLSEALTAKYPIVPFVGQEDADKNTAIREWVSQICTINGWTMTQVDSDIYFVSQYATSYTAYSIADLDDLANPTQYNVVELQSMSPVDDHSITVVPGYRKISIKSEKDVLIGNLFDGFADMVGNYSETLDKEFFPEERKRRRLHSYLMDKDSNKITLNTILFYRDSTEIPSGTHFPSVYPTTYDEADIKADSLPSREMSDNELLSGFASAHLARTDIYEEELDEDGNPTEEKRRYNFNTGLLIHMRLPKQSSTSIVGVQPSGSDSSVRRYPIATLKSKRPIDVSSGCLVFNITYKFLNGRQNGWYFNWGQFFRIRATFKSEYGEEVDEFWNDQWGSAEYSYITNEPTVNGVWQLYDKKSYPASRVPLSIKNDNQYQSDTIDTEKLDMPYNSSSNGYILPITHRLTGIMTLDIFPAYDSTANYNSWMQITDLSCEWCPIDNATKTKYDKEKEWKVTNNDNSIDLEEVTLKMHSHIDDEFSYGVICDSDGVDITTITLGDGTTKTPEQAVLDKYEEKMSASQRYYDIAAEYDASISPIGAIYGGKRFIAQKEVDWLTNKANYYFND